MFPMRNYNFLNYSHGHRGNIGDRYVASDLNHVPVPMFCKAFAYSSGFTKRLQISITAAPAATMAELMTVAFSGLVYVTMATPAVCRAPTMPDTSANTFLLIIL